ncbi:DUF4340 domain-containing protein [Methylacidimicrobium tartarophylax]|uniref:DUF4340 domain-containing protein n=1 Tax=Methylacidimicrobium tartarophylax TaxID=1041768 RepID=A0A5E6MLK0_9BACT|nr:DUF4340 domain-containing protein [Methylacidimicrobium tartarophylax]VVM06937.1 hypothetical protein MAMT_01467 [Methylacidimicrobium tartarophylax]
MKQFRSGLLLLLVALVLFGYITLVDRGKQSTEEQHRTEKQIFRFKSQDVNWLRIAAPDHSVTLEKKDNHWWIASPIRAEADDSAVERLLTEIEFLESERTIPAKEVGSAELLKQWGLAAPSLTVEFREGKETRGLSIGRKTAVRDLLYARAAQNPDAPVYLVNSAVADRLNKNVDDLRNRVVFGFDSLFVQRCGVEQAGSTPLSVEVVRQGTKWQLLKPLTARADATKVDEWLSSLTTLRVRKFVSDDGAALNQYGLASPSDQIWVDQKGEKPMEERLLIGSPVPGAPSDVYAKKLSGNAVFTLPAAMVQQMARGFFQNVRDRHVVPSFSVSEVVRLQVEQNGKSIGYAKRSQGWSVDGDGYKGIVDPERVEAFLRSLRALETQAFVQDVPSDLRAFGLNHPEGKVLIQTVEAGGSSPTPVELLIGRSEKDGTYVKNSSEPFIYRIASQWLQDLPKEAWQWKNREVLQLQPKDVQEVRLAFSSSSVTIRISPDGRILLNGAEGAAAPQAKAVVSRLWQLRAVRWIGPVRPEYGLSKPEATIVIQQASRAMTIRIGALLPDGGRAAQVEGDSLAFEFSAAEFQALGELARAGLKPTTPGRS